jgi:hypothetical protein
MSSKPVVSRYTVTMDLSCQWKEHCNSMSMRVMISLCIIECANKRMLWRDVNMCSSVWVGLYKPNQSNAGNVIHKLDFHSFPSPVLVVQHVYTFAEHENRPKSPNIKPSLMSVYNESQVINFLKWMGFTTILHIFIVTWRCAPLNLQF